MSFLAQASLSRSASVILSRPSASLSRWSQQRGPVTCVSSGFRTLYSENVSGEPRRHTQRTKGCRIGAAESCLRIISCECYLLLQWTYRLTATPVSNSTPKSRSADTRSSPFPVLAGCIKTRSPSHSRRYNRYWPPCIMSPSLPDSLVTPPALMYSS